MFDLVLLARAGWEMTDMDRQVCCISEFLKFDFPQSRPVAVRAAAISSDQEFACLRIPLSPHSHPPSFDGFDCERSGIMVDADAHPAFIM